MARKVKNSPNQIIISKGKLQFRTIFFYGPVVHGFSFSKAKKHIFFDYAEAGNYLFVATDKKQPLYLKTCFRGSQITINKITKIPKLAETFNTYIK